ncbi:hypothetical protein SLS62_000270 [Diatrype stigma]|uniref:Glycoside hydrolase family 92 protein n=1 Tax=Diatrype stigma TaxID=117547 RepID=A0AAN9YX47_9PEZI
MMRAVSALGVAGVAAVANAQQDLTQFVLPDTGSIDGGNTFPGVSLPMGMVKLGPDLYTGSDSYSGYQKNGVFIGWSMLHESGTGGAPKYGVVSQMPVAGTVDNPLGNQSVTRSAPDETRVGYYKSSPANGITVELGATAKAGMYKYTFPDNTTEANVIVDVSHVLSSYRGMGLGQSYLGGNLTVETSDSGDFVRYTGAGSYDNGWNRAPKWTVYFCGYFDTAVTYQTFLGKDSDGDDLDQYSNATFVGSDDARLGAVFSFGDVKDITSRVGVSFISTDQACQNVDDQIPEDTTLETLENDAKTAWNDQVLSKITTTDTNTTRLNLLYSSLYHMNLIPTNKTGENPLWSSTEPYYDDIFTFWDIFRCTTALFHILQPVAWEEFLRSLVDIWKNEGFMPDARSSFFNGATQGGSNADNILADAYVKGMRGAIDWEQAYAAMQTDAETVPDNNNDPRDTSSSTKEGRGALPDWLEHGYITTKYGRSVSRSIEYAGNDFGLYQVALGLGKTDDAEKYLNRSRNWRNQWNPDMEALGFTGFLGPIDEDGNFVDQDPLDCGGCYWGDDYYEGLPIEYSFNAHHDMSTLIDYSGGADNFTARLQAFFDGDGLFDPGNEPSFTTPYLFHYAGRPDLSVSTSRAVAEQHYAPTPGGLPGNSDAGAMESWILWNMIGLYPVTGQPVFLVGSPWFEDLTIDLGGGKTLHITSSTTATSSSKRSGTKAASASDATAYQVQSLKVNGKDWDKAWVSWDDVFANGGTMEFVLGTDAADWATGDLPPSPATEAKSARL